MINKPEAEAVFKISDETLLKDIKYGLASEKDIKIRRDNQTQTNQYMTLNPEKFKNLIDTEKQNAIKGRYKRKKFLKNLFIEESEALSPLMRKSIKINNQKSPLSPIPGFYRQNLLSETTAKRSIMSTVSINNEVSNVGKKVFSPRTTNGWKSIKRCKRTKSKLLIC